ncbi:hypothetical protein [Palleronia pelagia]|uniref:Uncharacterized protein n=1 Tax=Palleronia pelagia TaxID=387096 RepID=A0A1H8HYZ3_9RHOB|nr:hypothetical protein [Palleronia pelagia]SEN61221.1 hypothetical protein SAMN04488011_10546 [Palleronia pelagia]
MSEQTGAAELTRRGIFDLQVCVPSDWKDDQVVDFAETQFPSGTEDGWQIRREGNHDLRGDPERVQCSKHSTRVHIMLDA